MELQPTHLYKLVKLHPTLDGYHDASEHMCGGEVLMVPTAIPRTFKPQTIAEKQTPDPTGVQTIVWRAPFPEDASTSLMS